MKGDLKIDLSEVEMEDLLVEMEDLLKDKSAQKIIMSYLYDALSRSQNLPMTFTDQVGVGEKARWVVYDLISQESPEYRILLDYREKISDEIMENGVYYEDCPDCNGIGILDLNWEPRPSDAPVTICSRCKGLGTKDLLAAYEVALRLLNAK